MRQLLSDTKNAFWHNNPIWNAFSDIPGVPNKLIPIEIEKLYSKLNFLKLFETKQTIFHFQKKKINRHISSVWIKKYENYFDKINIGHGFKCLSNWIVDANWKLNVLKFRQMNFFRPSRNVSIQYDTDEEYRFFRADII